MTYLRNSFFAHGPRPGRTLAKMSAHHRALWEQLWVHYLAQVPVHLQVFVSSGSGTEHLPLLRTIQTDWATTASQNWKIFPINQNKPTVELFWLSAGCFQQNHPPWISLSEGGWGSHTLFNTTVHHCGHNLLYLLCQHLPNLVVDTWSKGCRQAEEVVLSEYVGLWNCLPIWQVLAVRTSLGYPGGKNSILGVVREGNRKCLSALKKKPRK